MGTIHSDQTSTLNDYIATYYLLHVPLVHLYKFRLDLAAYCLTFPLDDNQIRIARNILGIGTWFDATLVYRVNECNRRSYNS